MASRRLSRWRWHEARALSPATTTAAIGLWVLGDQLHPCQAALASVEPSGARVLLIESRSVLQFRRYHRQKLVLVWSAMRHFAHDLRQAGWTVDLIEAEAFGAALSGWIQRHGLKELRLMEPADRPFRQAVERLEQSGSLGVPLRWIPSNAFLWSREDFAAWARSRRSMRLETFYREGRRRFGVLIEDGQPLGGRWNFDHDNRRPPGRGLQGPQPLRFEPDLITQAVIEKVRALEQGPEPAGLPGSLEPFSWGVSRAQALEVLEHFIHTRLDGFGPHQDAMVSGQPTLWHALISPYLNLGLLHPLEVIQRLQQAGAERQQRGEPLPLASLEGVIRQILGWREYTHGLYHWFGPEYTSLNAYGHHRPLPRFFKTLGGSGMACVDEVLAEVAASGYAHHIQRLMVLANYGLLAGLDPQALTAWFHALFIDGHDWVMQTNVLGMGLHADGGRLASKPYAASGRYIQRMSTYCKGCRYDPALRTGPRACPFTTLYWNFLDRHEAVLRGNPRMALMLAHLDKLDAGERQAIAAAALVHHEATEAEEQLP
jgi:deoxyribodipyrimidine photolyase-related protein